MVLKKVAVEAVMMLENPNQSSSDAQGFEYVLLDQKQSTPHTIHDFG